MMALSEPSTDAVSGAQDRPIWALGFRPFFLLGASWAVAMLVFWVAYLAGHWPLSLHYEPVAWHAHEMIFGFAVAIIAGFILTASQNWTGIRGVHGRPLQVLVALWVAGRVLPILMPGWFAAAADWLFLPVLMGLLKPYLWIESQKRNKVFFVFLSLLTVANSFVHMEALGLVVGVSRVALLASLLIVILIIGLIAGRVIPFFTERAVPGAKVQRSKAIEILTHFLTVSFALVAVFVGVSTAAPLALAAALMHFIRWLLWRPWQAVRVPILFILYVAYAWIFIGLSLFGLQIFGWAIMESLATHALTVGALGTIVLAMISRVSLGHTGLRIHASPGMIFAYILITAAALVRVMVPLVRPDFYSLSLTISGVFWIAAYGLFVVEYAPRLLRARADGQPG